MSDDDERKCSFLSPCSAFGFHPLQVLAWCLWRCERASEGRRTEMVVGGARSRKGRSRKGRRKGGGCGDSLV